MKNKLIHTIVFLSIAVFASGQSLEAVKKQAGIQGETEMLLGLYDESSTHYAVGVELQLKCEAIYLLREIPQGKIHALATCPTEFTHEVFTSVQYKGSVSFQEENNSTWIVKNDREWGVVNLDLLRLKGWQPIRIPFAAADSIYLLNNGHFLTIKGNRKWHNEIARDGQIITNELFFEGNEFIPYYGGLIVPIRENAEQVYRYVQYQSFLFWDESVEENLPDPHFNYLKPDGYFKADEVVVPPYDEVDCHAVIRNGNKLQVYSFCSDAIVEDSILGYYQIPHYGILAIGDNHIAYGSNWKRIECKHPMRVEFEYYGDIVSCKVTLKDGGSLQFEIPE